jgi:NitT/TauT family transport system substrate-binding protein
MAKSNAFLVLSALALFAAPTFSLAQKNEKTLKPVSIHLNWKAEPEFGGFYAAQIHKLDHANNLNLKVIEGGAGAPVVQMVSSGRADFGIASGDEVLISLSRKTDVVALFAVFQKNPQAIMVRADSPYKTLSALLQSDSKIAMGLGLPYVSFLQNKYVKSTAKLVPYTGGIASFLADKNFAQQCFVGAEPLLAAKNGKPARAFLVADEGFNPYTTVLVTRRELLKKDPQLVKSVVQMVKAGWIQYLKEPGPTHAVISKLNTTMDNETLEKTLADQKPLILDGLKAPSDVGQMSLARWETLARQLFELKLTRTVVDAKQAFDNAP